MKIPKGQIDFIVNRLHVSTPDSEIEVDIRKRAAMHPGWTESKISEAVHYALKVHRANQRLYLFVTTGKKVKA